MLHFHDWDRYGGIGDAVLHLHGRDRGFLRYDTEIGRYGGIGDAVLHFYGRDRGFLRYDTEMEFFTGEMTRRDA